MPGFDSSTQPPIVLGQRYRLLRRVARDEHTETWEAHDTRLERPVLLRLLAEHARQNPEAKARLRAAASETLLSDDPDAPRVLDGGDHPMYGPFVVAELNRSMQPTQPFTVVNPPVQADIAEAQGSNAAAAGSTFVERPAPRTAHRTAQWQARPTATPTNRRPSTGILALGVLTVVVLAALAFVIRSFSPSAQSSVTQSAATSQPTRPLAGAPAPPVAQPAATATVVPTLAPPAQPKPQPTATLAPAIQPTSPPQPTAVPATSTAVPTPQPTSPVARQATVQPTAAPQVAAPGSPVDTVRQHYALINAKRYTEGYNLMTTNLRRLNSQSDYAGWFANKVSIEPISIDLVSQAGNQAVVRSVVQSTDRINGQNVTTQVSEQFVMQTEDGAWRIAQVSRL